MKAKNAVVGTRVQVKKGVDNEYYRAGQTGVIEKIISPDEVTVRFDHDNDYWYVHPEELKRIKE